MSQDPTTMNSDVEAYLQGRLSEAEAAAFEEAYLADPALLDELELTEKLKRGVGDVLAGTGRPVRRRRPFWSTPQYAIAASTLLAAFAVTSGLLLLEKRTAREVDGPRPVASSTRVLQLVAVRGDAAMQVAPAASGEWTVLLADPGFGGHERFTAVVADGEGRAIWTAADLTASFDGLVPVGLPGELLEPGDYVLTLEGLPSAAGAPPEQVAVYRFGVGAGTL